MRENYIPDWVVMEALERALGANVVGVEQRGDGFAVLIEDDNAE